MKTQNVKSILTCFKSILQRMRIWSKMQRKPIHRSENPDSVYHIWNIFLKKRWKRLLMAFSKQNKKWFYFEVAIFIITPVPRFVNIDSRLFSLWAGPTFCNLTKKLKPHQSYFRCFANIFSRSRRSC